MRTLLSLVLLPVLLAVSANAETMPLLKAAELTTKSLAVIKVAGKPMSDFFQVTALVRQSSPDPSDPAAVEWRAILAETKIERAGEDTEVMFLENRQEYRRVLEIRSDGSVTLGKIAAACPGCVSFHRRKNKPVIRQAGDPIFSFMPFTYFADPLAFAFMAEPDTECYFCRSTEGCLDGYCLRGVETVEAVCFSCLQAGRLKDLEIAANEIDSAALDPQKCDPPAVAEEIIYRTPPLPTWQDGLWPVKGGRPCRFLKIASRLDYTSKKEFVESLHECGEGDSDGLWEKLPDCIIRNLKDGQSDISFYLFDQDGAKLTTWDAN